MPTLRLGDCTEIIKTLDRVDAVITDPPYGVTYQSNAGAGKGTAPITNDGARLSLWLYRTMIPMLRAEHVLWFTRWDAWPDVWGILGQHFPLRGLLVWDKGTPGMGDLKHWGPSYELIASAGTASLRGARDGSILRYSMVPSKRRKHPTEKPIALLEYLIEKITDKGDTVLDPFMGSGTTGVACARTGRDFIGIEIDPVYFEIAKGRIMEAESQMLLSL